MLRVNSLRADGADAFHGHILALGDRLFDLIGEIEKAGIWPNLEGLLTETEVFRISIQENYSL